MSVEVQNKSTVPTDPGGASENVLDGARQDRPSSLADAVRRLGDIPLERIRWEPAPGTATEEDVVRLKCCELLDGVIVEKDMGWEESCWGVLLVGIIERYLQGNRIAVAAAADGLHRITPGRIRIPDVGVWLLSRFPGGRARARAICELAPDWAVEILSRSNTVREIEIKRNDFFSAGTRRVWIVDPCKRTIDEWTSANEVRQLSAGDVADLEDILPGFTVSIDEWFAAVDAVMGPGDTES